MITVFVDQPEDESGTPLPPTDVRTFTFDQYEDALSIECVAYQLSYSPSNREQFDQLLPIFQALATEKGRSISTVEYMEY